MLRKSRRAAISKTKRPTSVIFLGHILSNLLDSVGGDGLPQDQVDLLLSRHSILRRDLTIIMKSIVLHWLDTRFDIVVHLAESSINSNFIKSLPGVRFRQMKKLKIKDASTFRYCFSLLVGLISFALLGLRITRLLDPRFIGIYVPRIPILYSLTILAGRYTISRFPKCRRVLLRLTRLLTVKKLGTGRVTSVPLYISRAGRRCGCFGVVLANLYALWVLLINFLFLLINLLIKLIFDIIRYPIHDLSIKLEAWSIPLQVKLTQTVLLAMMFVDVALLVFIEEMHQPFVRW